LKKYLTGRRYEEEEEVTYAINNAISDRKEKSLLHGYEE
jgi:hypothetical protein